MLLKRFIAYLIDFVAPYVVVYIIFALILGIPVLGYLLAIATTLAYQALLLPATGQTPGKKMQGVKVRMLDGSPITMQTALIRTIGYYLNGIFLIGWIVALVTGSGFHDRLAKTEVVAA